MLGKLFHSMWASCRHTKDINERTKALSNQKYIENDIAILQKLLEKSPQNAPARAELGIKLFQLGQIEQAASILAQGIEIDPNNSELIANYAVILHFLGDFSSARHHYEQAWQSNPLSPQVFLNILKLDLDVCNWTGVEQRTAFLRQTMAEQPAEKWGTLITPIVAQLIDVTPAMRREIAVRRAQPYVSRNRERQLRRCGKNHRRIRLGYISCDFRDHAVSHLCSRFFTLHDRSRFEVFALSYGEDDGSAYRQRVVEDSDRFIDLYKFNLAQADRAIRQCKLDVLVDLSGYGSSGNPRLLAQRPAPVQINYLGFPGTIGPFMDYIVADPIVVPTEHEDHFFEKVIRMPHSYIMADDEQKISVRNIQRAELNLPDDSFVLCSFNDSSKIDRETFAAWMRIMAAIPDSILWLRARNEIARNNLLNSAREANIDPNRLIFSKRIENKTEYLAQYRAADLFLDTFPYNAHTIACDTLWAGLPLLTRLGTHFPARVAASLLTSVGLAEMVAASTKEYEARAIYLAQHRAELHQISERLRTQRISTPLFSTRAWVRDFEDLLEQIHSNSE